MPNKVKCRCGLSWSTEDCEPLETIICRCGAGIVVPEHLDETAQIARDLLASEYEAMDQAGSTAVAADIRSGVDSGYSARIALRAIIVALQSHSSRADAAEARVRELELALEEADRKNDAQADAWNEAEVRAGIAILGHNAATRCQRVAEAERDKLREALERIIEATKYVDGYAKDANNIARQALASITDEKSANGRASE